MAEGVDDDDWGEMYGSEDGGRSEIPSSEN
jgi:hypothetical protein